MKTRTFFITLFLLLTLIVGISEIHALATAPEFSQDEFYEILDEAETVLEFYCWPTYKEDSEVSALASMVGGEFIFLGAVEIDGRLFLD